MAGRQRQAVENVVKGVLPKLDVLALYRARVVAQAVDGSTVDVIPEDSRLPPMQGVPLRSGEPGTTALINPAAGIGTTVLIGWSGGDRRYPYACLWGGGETVTTLVLGGTPAEKAPRWETYRTAEQAVHTTLLGPAGLGAVVTAFAALIAMGGDSERSAFASLYPLHEALILAIGAALNDWYLQLNAMESDPSAYLSSVVELKT